MFAWKFAELNNSDSRFNAELTRIDGLSSSEARNEAVKSRTTP
jgi:hypothetical protein